MQRWIFNYFNHFKLKKKSIKIMIYMYFSIRLHVINLYLKLSSYEMYFKKFLRKAWPCGFFNLRSLDSFHFSLKL